MDASVAQILRDLHDLDLLLATPGAVAASERDGLLLKQRALHSRLDAAQTRAAARPNLRVIEGGWRPVRDLDVA